MTHDFAAFCFHCQYNYVRSQHVSIRFFIIIFFFIPLVKRYHDLFCLSIHILVSGLSSKQKRHIVYPLLSTFLSLSLLVEAADRKVSSLPTNPIPCSQSSLPLLQPQSLTPFSLYIPPLLFDAATYNSFDFYAMFFLYALHFSFQFLHFPLAFVSSVAVFAVAAVQVIPPAFHCCG